MSYLSRCAAIVFGIMMLVLAALVAVETIVRKVFGISIGGVDELSGYAIAIGGPLAFTVALIEQAHIRINLLHMNMPPRIQAIMNVAAALMMSALAVYLFVFTVRTVQETQLYGSIAQTPWATPLIYPQMLWLLAMGLFAVTAVILALRALVLVLRVDWQTLRRDFGPETVEEELAAELSDLQQR